MLPLHQSAKVTAKDGRVVFSLFSQCFLYSTCFTHHPGNLKGTNITLLTALLFLNGERLKPGCKPVIHTCCIRPCWWCHLYYSDHSFDNNHQMGCTPCSLHHSNILLWKGCYTRWDSNPHLLIAGQTCYHYTKVPRWQQRMEELCLVCSLSVSCIPPASYATQETWREPTSPCSQHCCCWIGRGWDLVASQLFMPVVLDHAGGAIYTMVTINCKL